MIFFLFFPGVLVSLHRRPQNRSKSVEAPSIDLGDARCGHGDLNKDALQQVIAAKWAVDVINAQSGTNDLKIGKSFLRRPNLLSRVLGIGSQKKSQEASFQNVRNLVCRSNAQ